MLFSKKTILVLVFLFVSNTTFAIDLNKCDNCTYNDMRSLALNSILDGTYAYYDTVDHEAYKFRVFTTREPGFYSRDVFPKSFSQDELDFLEDMFSILESTSTSSNKPHIDVNLSDVPHFQNTNAYDIYSTGSDRNNLAYWLDAQLSDKFSGGEVTNNSVLIENLLKFGLSHAKTNFNIDFSFDMVITFSDGSVVVFSFDFGGSAFPVHNKEDTRNQDALKNPIIYSNGEITVGNYKNGAVVKDDLFDAINRWGIKVIQNGSRIMVPPTGVTGIYECEYGVSKVEKCVYRE